MKQTLLRGWLKDILLITCFTLISILAIEIFCQAGFIDSPYVYLIVDEGIPFSEIGSRLEKVGLLRNKPLFLILGRMFGVEHRARAGRYRLKSTADLASILRLLHSGATYREKVTIPAGLTIEMIAHRLKEKAAVDSLQFVTLATDSLFTAFLGVASPNLEGYLYPDTYEIEWREDAAGIITRMVKSFFNAIDDSLRRRMDEIGMSLNEVVTLASIIEKEALFDRERPRISAVFHNRLKLGMRLQADPTVRYALKKWRGRLYYKDLEVDSPFNTYRVKGLPPHPICNPSRASIVAALYPQTGCKDLYFVAKGDGTHHFSRRSSEHLKAKAKYKRYLRSLRREGQNGSK